MACERCRRKKIKCDQTRPICKNCLHRSSACSYSGERRKRRGLSGPNPDSQLLTGSVYHDPVSSNTGRRSSAYVETSDGTSTQETFRISPLQFSAWMERNQDGNVTPPRLAAKSNYNLTTQTEEDATRSLLDNIFNRSDSDEYQDPHPAVWMRTDGGDEYTGPSSGLSSISDLGLRWIQDHIPDSAVLCETIPHIRNRILSHLRQPKCIPPGPWMGPDSPSILQHLLPSEVAEYVDVYFSTAQNIFPVLDRDKFETQLAQFGVDPTGPMYSWKCLLNAVLASGCRAAMSEETAAAFQASGRHGWGYFENALYYEAKLMHCATDLMAVQALAVMTVFAQGMSSPQRLEYNLSSMTTRLAQALALHRRPPPEWNLSDSEKKERNRLFWVVYCLDKTIALRCGRPSVIKDNDISCSFPHSTEVAQNQQPEFESSGVAPAFDFFLSFSRLARICGIIADRLYSAAALCSMPPKLVMVGEQILEDLESWRQSISAELRPGRPFGRITYKGSASKTHLLVLHSSYYYAICAVHRRFTPMFMQDHADQQCLTLQPITVTHIEAARSLVLLTKYLDIESCSPGWLVFYYPMTALTTIFMHIVYNTSNASIHNDIALMDVVVGFFGRVEFITSGEASFTKTSEFVRLARCIVDKSQPTAPINRLFADDTSASVSSPQAVGIGNDALRRMSGVAVSEHDKEIDQRSLLDTTARGETSPLVATAAISEKSQPKLRDGTNNSYPEIDFMRQQTTPQMNGDMDLIGPVSPFGDVSSQVWLEAWMLPNNV